jgi:hypothetical protein
MASETDKGSITLSDPNNGPLARWAADRIEEFTKDMPVGAGFITEAIPWIDKGGLTLVITRDAKLDVKETDCG